VDVAVERHELAQPLAAAAAQHGDVGAVGDRGLEHLRMAAATARRSRLPRRTTLRIRGFSTFAPAWIEPSSARSAAPTW
jgi:hypothetical protein